jgi:hypothetical protein
MALFHTYTSETDIPRLANQGGPDCSGLNATKVGRLGSGLKEIATINGQHRFGARTKQDGAIGTGETGEVPDVEQAGDEKRVNRVRQRGDQRGAAFDIRKHQHYSNRVTRLQQTADAADAGFTACGRR